MDYKTKYSNPIFAAFIFFLLVTSWSCSNTKRKQTPKLDLSEKQTPGIGALEKNETKLFDGETLSGWEITSFGTEGPVQVTDGKIVLAMGDGLTGITWNGEFPQMNYEVSLEAMKMSGNDFFCGMTFPVDSTYCSFIVGGWGGPVVGLSTIDDRDASENSTKTLKRFEKDVWYAIRLRVTPGKIEGWVDDEKMVDFATAGHKIGIRPEVSLSRPFGIASWITTSALRNIRLKNLDKKDHSVAHIRARE